MSNIALGLYKYVDGVNDTPFPSSANQAFLVDWQYGARRMGGAPSITGGTINHTICLDNDWSMDVYVEYKGEKFFPSHKPTSSYSAQSITYEHKVDFYSERLVLDNVYFYDVVSSGDSGGKPVSNSTKFTFFGNITEFIARLNASMQRDNTGYSAVLDPNQANADLEKQIKFDTKYISEALQEGFKAFGIPYYFVGKVCHYGDSQSSAIDNIVFEYGKDNSLMSIEKTNANTKIVNRITGVGSGDNIPYYYPNSCEQGVVDIANLISSTITNLEIFDDMLFAKKVKRDAVLTYNMWSFNVDTPIFYLDNKPYTNGKGFSSDEIAQGQTLHVVVPFEVKYDGCTDFFMRFSVRPVATAISNLSLSPAISGVTPTADNGMVYVNALNKNIAKGKYQLAFDVNISAFSLILQVFKTESCTIYANGWKDSKDNNFYKDLEEIGIMMTGVASAGDNFKQIISKYIPPQSNLMPSIYRDSDGEERFYDAANNTYVNPDTGDYYEFPNPYANGKPKEFIKDYKDVKPTIAGAVNSASEPIDQIIKFAYDENDNDDLEEDGVTYKHPYFFALLHRTNGTYGFNLFDHTIDEGEMSLSFTSGRMGGCEFVIGVGEDSQKNLVQIVLDGNLQPQLDEDGHPILARDAETGDVICGREGQGTQIPQDWQNDTRRNEVWVALKKDITTYGVIMPNATNNYRPKDEEINSFVILHIDLPKAYILAAEQSIDNLLISYMAESNTEHWNFGIDFSRIYLKDTPNIATALDENKKIKIRYNGEIYSRYVLGYTYKTLIGEPLPSISIELAESLEGSTSALDTAINEINNMVEQQANAMIGYQQIARLARGALQTSNVEGSGSNTRPIYFDGHKAKVIDGLEVPESIHSQKDIQADRGMAAGGLANLGMGGGGQGDVTSIKFDPNQTYQESTPYTANNGLVLLPAYPSLAGYATETWVGQNFAGKAYETRVQTLEGYFTGNAANNALLLGGTAKGDLFSALSSDTTNAVSITIGGTPKNISVATMRTSLGLGSAAYVNTGAAEGDVPLLGTNGLIPSSMLPSYVDDVLEYASVSAFPSTGESGKIYVALDTNLTYRWGGTSYVEISPSLALGTNHDTAFYGDYGQIAYAHATDANRLTTAKTSGFYKFATTAEGHIAGVTNVADTDIVNTLDTTPVNRATGDASGNNIANTYATIASFNTLKTGLTSKGAHNLPIYLNSSAEAVAIDALNVTGAIESTQNGVAAGGISGLSMNGGTQGTVTRVDVGTTQYEPVAGIVSLPAYPVIPTNISAFTNDAGYITGITSAMVTTALGFTPFDENDFTQANIQSTLGISNWALAASKPSYTLDEVSDGSTRKLSNYVTLNTAQTITGGKTFQSDEIGNAISVKRNSTGNSIIKFENTSGVIGYIGVRAANNQPYFLYGSDYTIWHAGNSNLSTVDWAVKELTAAGQIVSNVAQGTAPLAVTSKTLNTNLNADLLDGKHSSDFVSALGTSGDYLTWTKTGGSDNNITIPYATKALKDNNGAQIDTTYLKLANAGLGFDGTSLTLKNGNSTLAIQSLATISSDFTLGNIPDRQTAQDSNPALKITIAGQDRSIARGSNIDINARNLIGFHTPLTDQVFRYRTTAGTANIGNGQAHIDSIKGNSLVWNSKWRTNTVTSWKGITVSETNGLFSFTGTSTGNDGRYLSPILPNGHKAYIRFVCTEYSNDAIKLYLLSDYSSSVNITGSFSRIISPSSNQAVYPIASINTGKIYNTKGYWTLIDLTLLFNNDIPEGLTAETFERDYGYLLLNPEYNAGSLISFGTDDTLYETVGFNQWDEEWELGNIDYTTGGLVDATNRIRSKNYIPVKPSTKYYIKTPASSCLAKAYDQNYKYIGAYNNNDWIKNGQTYVSNLEIQTPANCCYLKINLTTSYGAVYNHDICINLSWSGNRNGQYEGYWKETKHIPITQLKGKLNGTGNIVTVYPDGMRRAGSAFDEIVKEGNVWVGYKRMGSVDLGTLSWSANRTSFESTNVQGKRSVGSQDLLSRLCCAKYVPKNVGWSDYPTRSSGEIYEYADSKHIAVCDSAFSGYTGAQVADALSGVECIYELATYERYVLVDDLGNPIDLDLDYRVDDQGTECWPQVSTTMAPPYIDVTYKLNAVDDVRGLPSTYVKKDYLKNRGSEVRPIYFDEYGEPKNIQGLSVPNSVESTMGGMSAGGIANLEMGAVGSGTLTQIQVNGTGITDVGGVVNITAAEGNTNGAFSLAGQSIPVHGLGSLAYKSSLAFSELTSKPTTLSGYGIADAVSTSALASWAGTSNITILGTISTGVWNGTAVGVAYGGTGATTASDARTNLGLGSASTYNATSSVTQNSTDLVTSGAVYAAIDNLPEPMIMKGTLGTNGTITSLPTASASNEGFTYKVITAGTYASQAAKVGDVFVSCKPVGASAYEWILIPAGDTDSDTWRNIKVNGTELLGSAISSGAVNFKNGGNITVTGSGNDITLGVASGYGIPTTTKQSNWDTAYSWGNHANAGYALASSLADYLPLSGGTIYNSQSSYPLVIKGSSTVSGIIFDDSSNNTLGRIYADTDHDISWYNGTSSYTMLHTGNTGDFYKYNGGTGEHSLNDFATAQGYYYINGVTTDVPTNGENGQFVCFRGNSADTYGQMILSYGGDFWWRGATTNNTTRAWRKIFDSENSNLSTVDWACRYLNVVGDHVWMKSGSQGIYIQSNGIHIHDSSDAYVSTLLGFDLTNSRVGICKSSPSYPLDVNGEIGCTGVQASYITDDNEDFYVGDYYHAFGSGDGLALYAYGTRPVGIWSASYGQIAEFRSRTALASAESDVLRLASSGNLGCYTGYYMGSTKKVEFGYYTGSTNGAYILNNTTNKELRLTDEGLLHYTGSNYLAENTPHYFRDPSSPSWAGGMYWGSYGNEALSFIVNNSVSRFQFVGGTNIANWLYDTWTTATPWFTIKADGVETSGNVTAAGGVAAGGIANLSIN